MSRMDRIRVGETVSSLRAQLRNWYTVGPAAWLVMLSPARHLLEGTAVSRRPVSLRFRDGRVLRCRINDLQAYIEVFLLRDYDVDGLDWASLTTIVDVGANVGTAALWFAEQSPRARVVAVEPGHTAQAMLRQNLAANALSDRVEVVEAAIGEGPGTANLVEPGATVQSHLARADEGGYPVRVLGLDGLLEEASLERVDVLKVDCEGSEFALFRGASDAALQRVEAVVGEWHPSSAGGPAQIEDRLQRSGFDVTMIPHPALPGFGNFVARRAQAQ